MNMPESTDKKKLTQIFVVVVASCLILGGLFGYAINAMATSNQLHDMENAVNALEAEVSDLQSSKNDSGNITGNMTINNVTYNFGGNVTLSDLYSEVKNSVVVIHAKVPEHDFFGNLYYSEVQGTGFIANITGKYMILTNNHVVNEGTNITVTFIDGNTYKAEEIGSDAYIDLAVLSANAPLDEYAPLVITSSSTLKVGDSVVAIGTPYGLAGTVTSGIVSALGRTINEDTAGGYVIANCIQTTTPINPGNSGGPLLNYQGEVVGITTAIVTDSVGLGFAIPSTAILREARTLVLNGSYLEHPSLGIYGTDMNYEISQAMGLNVTYGWLVAQVVARGAAEQAGIQGGSDQVSIDNTMYTIGGDVIIAIDGNRIINIDGLSAYLEEHTVPGQTINVTIVRGDKTLTLPVVLQARSALAG